MLRRTRLWTGGVIASAAACLAGLAWQPASTVLAAGTKPPGLDTDGDGLPDLLEHVTLSDAYKVDTDEDGRSDLTEVLERTSPLDRDTSKALPDAFRILVNTTDDGPGRQSLWIHLLLRIRSGLLADLKGVSLFLDCEGERCSLDPILSLALSEVVVQPDSTQGLLVRAAFRIPVSSALLALDTVTIGGYCSFRSALHASGTVLINQSGSFLTLVPVGQTLLVQGTNQTQASSPFWSGNKACVLTLEVQGATKTGLLCEVQKAECETSQALRCVPDCGSMKGHTIFVPDGLALILGG